MKKKLSLLLIIIGIVLLLITPISHKIMEEKIKAENERLDQLAADDLDHNEDLEGEFDYSSIQDLELSSVFFNIDASYDKVIIGQIRIPDLGINLPILKGTTNANLLVGATTMLADQKMGEGNYPLAGHYMRDPNLLFGNLLNIEENTLVQLTNKKMIYDYRIIETKVVPDSAQYMIEHERAEEQGKPLLSLMTCYYTSKSGKRFFAIGELVDQYPYEPGLMK